MMMKNDNDMKVFGTKYARPQEWHTKQNVMIRKG